MKKTDKQIKFNHKKHFRLMKFRAWDLYDNKMLNFTELTSYNDGSIGVSAGINPTKVFHKTDYLIPLQFTGFQDCEGNDIYEGDILSDYTETDEGLTQSFLQVFWCKRTGAWRLDNSYHQDKTSSDLLSDELNLYNYYITGHIFETKTNTK